VRIGRGTIVTAGSVVFRNLPAGVIATGNPARPAGFIPSPEAGADKEAAEKTEEKHG